VIGFWLRVILALALGAGLVWFLSSDPGYVLLELRGWVIESTVLGFVLAVVISVVLIWAVTLLLRGTVRLPVTVRDFRDRRRSDKAAESFEHGLLLLAEGRWKQAEHELVRRAADHDLAQLNYLGAAIAARQQQSVERRDRYLQLAVSNAIEDPIAAMVTQARLLVADADYVAARAVLQRLRAQVPDHPDVIVLLLEVLDRLGEDGEPARLDTLTVTALGRELEAAARIGDLDRVKALVAAQPPDIQRDVRLRRSQVRCLLRLDAHREAAGVIEADLARDWDAELVLTYGQLQIDDGISQLSSIEQWLSRYGERPELLLTAGRVCMLAQLWGKARSYLDAAANRAPSVETYAELARWSELTHDEAGAARFWKAAAELALTPPTVTASVDAAAVQAVDEPAALTDLGSAP